MAYPTVGTTNNLYSTLNDSNVEK